MDLSAVALLHPHLEPELGLLILTLDHGKANEMGTAQLDAFERLCGLLEADDQVVCLCTTSRKQTRSGTPIFVSGADVTERVGWDVERVKAHVARQREIMRRLRRLPLFTTVVCHGLALGWGLEFLLTADRVLATPESRFALPETGLGILPGARGTADLAFAVGVAEALRLGCVGEEIAADAARDLGLVHEVVPDREAGLARVRDLATALRRRSPTAVAAYKTAVLDALGRSESERLALEAEAYGWCVDSGEAARGREAFERIRAGGSASFGPRLSRRLR